MRARIGQLSFIATLLIGCGGGGGSGVAGTAIAPPPTVERQTFVLRDTTAIDRRLGASSICPWMHTWLLSSTCAAINSATVTTVDGRPFDIGRIAGRTPRGQIALVRGSFSKNSLLEDGRAAEVDIQHAVVGEIETNDPARAQLSVLGQRIQVLESTWFEDGVAIDDLVPGRRVAVSGYFTTDSILATAILDDSGTEYEWRYVLRGILQRDAAGGFRVGALRLDLSSADVVAFPGGAPSDGDVVLVFANAPPVHSVLAARSIHFVGDDLGWGSEDIRFFAGLVTRRVSPTELEIEGRRVDCATFRCEDLTQADVGRLVSVTHTEDNDTANVLSMGNATYEITGRVSAIDVPSGSVTVLGYPARFTPATLVVDAQEQPARLSEVGIGDTVTVIAGLVGNVLVASRIETFGSGQWIVSNWVDVFSDTLIGDPEIRILGRTFVTSASTPVFEDCTGERSPEWLLDVWQQAVINTIRIEVPVESPGPIAPIRIDVATEACSPWDY